MNARSQQNSVNDGKIQEINFVVGCFNKFFLCYKPSVSCKVVKTLYA